jgi:hypothetical protein
MPTHLSDKQLAVPQEFPLLHDPPEQAVPDGQFMLEHDSVVAVHCDVQ